MIDPQTGLPLLGAATPPPEEPTQEFPLDPKINAELKEAIKTDLELGEKLNQYGVGFLVMLRDALALVEKKGASERERMRIEHRAIASSGIHEAQIRGFDLDRGTVKFVKKVN